MAIASIQLNAILLYDRRSILFTIIDRKRDVLHEKSYMDMSAAL